MTPKHELPMRLNLLDIGQDRIETELQEGFLLL
jgi:hypothetical protein